MDAGKKGERLNLFSRAPSRYYKRSRRVHGGIFMPLDGSDWVLGCLYTLFCSLKQKTNKKNKAALSNVGGSAFCICSLSKFLFTFFLLFFILN